MLAVVVSNYLGMDISLFFSMFLTSAFTENNDYFLLGNEIVFSFYLQ